MIVEKQPIPEGTSVELPSPDSYDATILAFIPDSNFGVKRMRWTA
ncbi:MAG: hypothetical protein OXE92_02520 [Bacteroidetes bacterium]|nr:hypothetical protein [Bacteroidota bacterium]MCY4204582.1 hypothetical protein [Bacteroidota bacterium]